MRGRNMITLFLDTSNTKLIVGIYKENTCLFKSETEVLKDLSSKVLPTIKESLNEVKLTVNDINKILVVNGPGSFTGIRVGVTITKTMAWAKKIAISIISELELLSSTNINTDYIVPIIDARRDFYYTGIYDKNGNVIMNDIYISKENLLLEINKITTLENVTFVSYDKIEEFKVIEPVLNIEKIIEKHRKDVSLNPHNVNPNYLKRVEAEEKLDDKRN